MKSKIMSEACGGKSAADAQPWKPAVGSPLVANTQWHRLFIGPLMGHAFSRFVLRTSSGHSNSFRSVSNPHGSLGRFCAVWASARSSPQSEGLSTRGQFLAMPDPERRVYVLPISVSSGDQLRKGLRAFLALSLE